MLMSLTRKHLHKYNWQPTDNSKTYMHFLVYNLIKKASIKKKTVCVLQLQTVQMQLQG